MDPVTVFFACPGGLILLFAVLFIWEGINPNWLDDLDRFFNGKDK
jgi:hypothetical protein